MSFLYSLLGAVILLVIVKLIHRATWGNLFGPAPSLAPGGDPQVFASDLRMKTAHLLALAPAPLA
jgi:hypothetical protein